MGAGADTAAEAHGGRRIAADAALVLAGLVDGISMNGLSPVPAIWICFALAAVALTVRHRAPELALLAAVPGLYLGCLSMAPLIALYSVA
ncbi:hypothetical protein ACFXAO_27235 [Streptomyces lavendulae]|uniref:hypothetical protein n=1 Tax=Streptomyces lavendulae TaxID=1914 RepID=UPI00367AD3A9